MSWRPQAQNYFAVQECDARGDATKNYGSAPLTTPVKKVDELNLKQDFAFSLTPHLLLF